ncbi:MAG: hypothetical protein ACODAE_10240 [Gemmatimonadota bacterium]
MRRYGSIIFAVVLALAIGAPTAAQQDDAELPEPIEVGAVAPDFELPGATRHGVLAEPVRLSDYEGEVVVLSFFFRARTRG